MQEIFYVWSPTLFNVTYRTLHPLFFISSKSTIYCINQQYTVFYMLFMATPILHLS